MTVVAGRDYLRCDFCHTFSFPEQLEDSADQIQPLDKKSDMTCPCCEQPLELGLIDTCEIHFCGQCRGILIPSESLAHVIKQRRMNWEGADATPTPLNQDELKRRIACPNCDTTMDVHPYYGPGNVVIDSCHRCRQVWVDHGEIAAIERAPGVR